MSTATSNHSGRTGATALAVLAGIGSIFAGVYYKALFWPLIAAAIVAALVAAYEFGWLPVIVSWSGWGKKRRRKLRPVPSSGISPVAFLFYPSWLNPNTPRKALANTLLHDGQQILNFMPKSLPASSGSPMLAALIAASPPVHPYYVKSIAQWEDHVSVFLHARASDSTALFKTSDQLPTGLIEIRAYLEERLSELRAIHTTL